MHIVTGGAGFIGSAFVSRLNAEGIEDIIIVDELSTSEKWKNLLGKSFVDYIHKDDFLNALLAGKFERQVSSIVHMGACSATTETDADFLMNNNFKYSRSLAEYALEKNIRFLYASSAATYGDGSRGYSDDEASHTSLLPQNRYGYSKQLFDLWVMRQAVSDRVVGLKFFNVYGPNESHKEDMRSVVNKAYHWIQDSGKVTLFKSYRDDYTDGEQKRDFIYVKDCSEAMLWFLNNPDANGIFNLGTGQARTWNDLANAVFSALGREPKIEYIEMPASVRDHYQYFTEADMSRFKATGCPVNFHSLENGVRDYVQNYLDTPHPYL